MTAIAAVVTLFATAACGTAPAPAPEGTFTTLPSPPPARAIDALPKGLLDRLDPSPELLKNVELARQAKAPLVVGVPASKAQPGTVCWTVVLTPQGNGSWRSSVAPGYPATTGVALTDAQDWSASGDCEGLPRYADAGESTSTGAAVLQAGRGFAWTRWIDCNPQVVVLTPAGVGGWRWTVVAPLTSAGAVATPEGANKWREREWDGARDAPTRCGPLAP